MIFRDPMALGWLAAIPLLLLLYMLSRPPYSSPVSNLFLWQRASQPPRARMRPRRVRLGVDFFLQALFLLLLAVSLARPAIPSSAPARVAMIFDLSASMGVLEQGTSRIELARRRALAMLDRIERPAEVTIVGAADRPINVADRLTDRSAVNDALQSLAPRGTSSDLVAAVSTVLAMEGELAHDAVWLFGDGAGNAAPPDADRVRFVAVGSSADNVGIAALTVRRNPFDSSLFQAMVEVVNPSLRARSVPLHVSHGGRVLLDATLALRAAERRLVFVDLGAVDEPVAASIGARDDFAADDRAVASSPTPVIDVLLVSAGNRFLESALTVEPRFRTTQVSPVQYRARGAADDIDVVVLDGVAPVAGVANRLLVFDPSGAEPMELPQPLFVLDPSHPIVDGVDWSAPGIARVTPLPDEPGGTVLVEAGGQPVLVAYRDGPMRVVTLGFDLRGSTWVRTPAFPIFVSNALDWLHAEPGAAEPSRPNPLDAAESDIRPVFAGADDDPLAAPGDAAPTTRDRRRAFLLLAFVVLVVEAWVAWTGGRLARPRGALYLRLAACLLVVASIIGLPRLGNASARAVVWALDVSDSIDEPQSRVALAHLDAATGQLSSSARAGLVIFGQHAAVARDLGGELRFDALPRHVPGVATDIAAGLRLAAAKLPPEGGRLVLVSDGNETSGDALREARALAARGIHVDALAVGNRDTAGAPGVAAGGMTAPREVPVGDPFTVTVGLYGQFGAGARVALYREGSLIAETDTVLQRAGRNELTFPVLLDAAGLHALTAQVTAEVDADPTDNATGTVVRAVAAPTALAVTTGGMETITARMLRDTGFDLAVVDARAMPETEVTLAAWDLVVLDDLTAAALSPAQSLALARHVEETGGGLVLVGGLRSFGPSGFGETALEASLPIDIRPPDRIDRAPLSVVLVLDTSGSMSREERGIAKIESARRAVVSLLDVLEPFDRVGLVAFAESPREVAPLSAIAAQPMLADAVAALTAGGGTAIGPALTMAYDRLQKETARKHVLLVSDGQAEDEDLDAILRRVEASEVELSVVGIGDDVDWDTVAALSQAGGGRTYRADAAQQLAEILLQEAALMSGQWMVERTFRVRAPAPHELLGDLHASDLPDMHGYIATVRKPGADAVLESDLGDPVLAAWSIGLGRSATFTAPLPSPWAADLLESPAFATLWTRALRWTMRRMRSDQLHAEIELFGDRALVTVDAVDRQAGFLNGLTITGSVRTPEGRSIELSLPQSGPGRYQTWFDASFAGTYRARLDAVASPDAAPRDGGEAPGSVQLGVHIARTAEHSAPAADLELLRRITEITGGQMIVADADPFALVEPARDNERVWRPAAILALLALFFEVAVRRGVIPALPVSWSSTAATLRGRISAPRT